MNTKPYVPSEMELVQSHAFFAPARPQCMDVRAQAAEDAIQKIKAAVWDEAYRQGVEDERTAGAVQMDVGPNRNNPYRIGGGK